MLHIAEETRTEERAQIKADAGVKLWQFGGG